MRKRCVWLRLVSIVAVAGAAFAQARPEQHRAPFLNLGEGRRVTMRYHRTLGGGVRALSSAKADFDEDGMPDLAAGFSAAGGAGSVAIHRGNVDALWPYGVPRDAEPPAFLPDARVFELPEAPDFLAAGDFDADGHQDLVAAHAGSNSLYFLKGDGHGGFADARRIALGGAVTALTAGEINRPDGLTDLMVAVTGDSGAQVLVFESPNGALAATPEAFDLPADAAALTVMPLDGGLMNGLAVAAGRELLLVHGRDRKLTLAQSERDSVPPAAVTRQTFPFALRSLAVGHFTSPSLDLAALGDDGQIHILERPDAGQAVRYRSGPLPRTSALRLRTSIGLPVAGSGGKLVTARVAATGRDSLVVLDPAGRKLHIVSHRERDDALSFGVAASVDVPGAPAALEAMRINKDALHDLVVLADSRTEPVVYATGADFVQVVTNTSDNDAGSLRWAILAANMAAGAHLTAEIDFHIPATDLNRNPTSGVFTIQPVFQDITQALPHLSSMTIDAYTQPGSSPNTLPVGDNAQPLIEINGGLAGAGPCGLALFGAATVIRGVVITSFNGTPDPKDARILDGGCGMDIESDSNVIEGNFIGIDAGGTVRKGNSAGILTMANDYSEDGSTIGGIVPQARNLISGNGGSAIQDSQMAWANTFFIQGNYLGTDRTGTQVVLNSYAGVMLYGAFHAVVGGTAAGAGNLISGNYWYNVASGIGGSGPFHNLIQGNLIGTDATGKLRIEPFGEPVSGVSLSGTNGDTLGGTTPAARNIISGNRQGGVWMAAGAENLLIEGNYIGVDTSGTQALPNSVGGVVCQADWTDIYGTFHTGLPVSNTTIGGTAAGAGNVISGNDGPGVSILGLTAVISTEALNNVISGNLIGTDAAGAAAIPNQGDGIVLQSYAGGNTIGGLDAGAGNIIAYNTGNGIQINPGGDSGITDNAVIGNSIFSNIGAGVRIPSGTRNHVSANSIYSNGALGIDIDAAGVLANSACQGNTAGANLLQDAPVLTAGAGNAFVTATATDPNGNTSEFSNCVPATLSGNLLSIAGTLDSLPSTSYTVEYFSNPSCDASGFGQGKVYLGSTTVTTTSGGCSGSIGGTLDLSSADLSVTNSPNNLGFAVNVPGSLPYTSVVTNPGPRAASAVVWTDVLPDNVTLISIATTQGSCAAANQKITCSLGNMRVGSTVTLTLSVLVSAAGNYSNTMSVASPTLDSNQSNNSATVSLKASYAPYIDHLTPTSVKTGSAATTVTVVGQGLIPSNVVSFNGTAYPTTFTANWNSEDCGHTVYGQTATYCNALSITVPAALLTAAATYPVTVDGVSGTLTFSVVVVPGPVNHFVLSGFGNSVAAGAMEMLYITAEDANGLTVTTYTGTVTLTSSDPAPTVFTAGGGTNSVTFTTSEAGMAAAILELQTTGTQTVTATDASNPAISGTISANVAYGAASSLALTGTPQAAAPNYPFPQPLSVTVTDNYGNAVPNQKVTFSAPASGAGATLSSTAATTDIHGVASVTATANGTSGAYQVGVTFGAGVAGGGANADVFLLTNGSGLATLTATGGTPQYTFAGQLFPNKLQAKLVDGMGNPISGVTIWFRSATVVVSGAMVTDASGSVSVTANAPSNATAGTYAVTASAGGLTATFQLTIKTPQPVVVSIASGSPQTAAAGYGFGQPLEVLVTDGWGNPRAGAVVTYIPPGAGASATLSAGTAVTDAYGNASVTATANATQGSYSVTASVGSASVSFALTNGPPATGPPASITALAGTPQMRTVGYAFATAFQVVVKNAGGIALPGVSVTFSAPSSGPGGAFSGSATVLTNGVGVATAPTFTANTVTGSYAVTATAGAVSTTFALTNLAGAAADWSIYAGNNQTATLNTAFGTPLAVRFVDSYGNGAAGTALFFVNGSGAAGTFSGSAMPSVTADSNGIATAPSLTANGTAGAFAVIVLWNYSKYLTFSLTNTAAVPAHLIAAGGTPQNAFNGAAFASALSAEVTDAGNNPLAGFTVTFAAPLSGASALLSNASAITDSSGVATVSATAGAVSGSYRVIASLGTLTAAFALSNVSRNRCDLDQNGTVDVVDVQAMIKQVLGAATAANDLNSDGEVNVNEIQIVANAALQLACMAH